jgi:arylsulfatase A-like enzyme
MMMISTAKARELPNIVIFLVDDMGVMDSSVAMLTDAMGKPQRHPLNDWYRTPNLQRLADQGIRFSNFYAMSVCSPTRISIMTGQNAARHGTTNWIDPLQNNAGKQGPTDWNWLGLNRQSVTLAGLLRNQGYRTIHIGKGHFGPDQHEGADPTNLGFEINIAGAAWGQPGSYRGQSNYGRNRPAPNSIQQTVPHLEKYHGTDTFLTEALTREACQQLEQSVAEQLPFFLHLAHYAVHSPFEADARFIDNYAQDGRSLESQAFASMIEGVDKSLGDLLDKLEELHVAEKTLIFFLGDNGTDAPLGHQHAVACAAPLRGKKGSHYEGGMRAPLVVAWAGPSSQQLCQQAVPIQAGAVQSQVASVVDLSPTLLGLSEAQNPVGHIVDGRPLDRLLSGLPDPDRPQQFLMHYPHGVHRSSYFTVWRDGDWKLIYHYFPTQVSGNSHYQLFHLSQDPAEQNDLATSHPDQLRPMVEELQRQLAFHSARYPIDIETGKPVIPVVPPPAHRVPESK